MLNLNLTVLEIKSKKVLNITRQTKGKLGEDFSELSNLGKFLERSPTTISLPQRLQNGDFNLCDTILLVLSTVPVKQEAKSVNVCWLLRGTMILSETQG